VLALPWPSSSIHLCNLAHKCTGTAQSGMLRPKPGLLAAPLPIAGYLAMLIAASAVIRPVTPNR
jgi:hypothetical protein